MLAALEQQSAASVHIAEGAQGIHQLIEGLSKEIRSAREAGDDITLKTVNLHQAVAVFRI